MTRAEVEFTDRVVIVTGAGSGIGRAAALAFARAGARVLGVGRRREALETTARQHPGVAVFAADICADDAPEAVVRAAVDRWGAVDVLVNNAGATALMPLAEATASGISDLFRLNVTAPSLLAHAALPHLRRTSGAIVNVSSTYGHRPMPHAAHYAATKSALEHLTRSWALELAPDQTRKGADMALAMEMTRIYPADLGDIDHEALVRCIEDCISCAQACTACADACLSEADAELPMLRKCIRTDEDCADICATTARVLSRHTGYDANITRIVLEACATACRSCAEECERHADRHEHCKLCAQACRRCEQACRMLLVSLG